MNCYHCGDKCNSKIVFDDKNFCCNGCKTVYEILKENQLDNFYNIEASPGIKVDQDQASYYDFLELDDVKEKYLYFENDKIKKIVFHLPQIHCNSCIWLLENLPKLYEDLQSAEVNFNNKNVQFTLSKSSNIVEFASFLQALGYAPDFSDQKKKKKSTLLIKIAVAGFCFGNIMLFAFPEYLGMKDTDNFRNIFLYLSFALSLPVTFYSASDYFKNAFIGAKNGVLNMDFPIVLGLVTLFIRSTYELFVYTGQAYFDSLAGLIFFLLIGKWYQEKTYNHLNFNRSTKSFFPIAVLKKEKGDYITTHISELKKGDIIQIRQRELIPCDAVLIDGNAAIDYSFVTGESTLVYPDFKEEVFAGGRQKAEKILLKVLKTSDESYLTALWNAHNKNKKKKENKLNLISNGLSKYFTYFILLLSLSTAVYWYFNDANLIWKSVSAVLIVACPCALALSLPFTYGNAQRQLSKSSFFVRKMDMVDRMHEITDIVFDKTGTLTDSNSTLFHLHGNKDLTLLRVLYSATLSSMHPLSLGINAYLEKHYALQPLQLEKVEDLVGKGLQFTYKGNLYKLGSKKFTEIDHKDANVGVVFTKNGEYQLHFSVHHNYRKGLALSLKQLQGKYVLHLLTGDNDEEKEFLQHELGIKNAQFYQSPEDKLNYVKSLEDSGKKVMMIGDGINDAVALSESTMGVAVANKSHSFTPASDAILEAKNFTKIPQFISFANYSRKIVVISFILSFLYNAVGLFIAVQGIFAPVFAAILMPLSSISVVFFTTASTTLAAKHLLNKAS